MKVSKAYIWLNVNQNTRLYGGLNSIVQYFLDHKPIPILSGTFFSIQNEMFYILKSETSQA